MSFTAAEITYALNCLIDYHEKGPAKQQTLQKRPTFDRLMAGKKTFPGGETYITWQVSGAFTTAFVGYTHDDDQQYGNPTNVKQAKCPWYEMGAGLQIVFTELKKAGITVVDSAFGKNTSVHSGAEQVQLTNILEDKFFDMTEGCNRSFAEICWRDGTQDAKVFPGIPSFILGAPTTGITFGLDRAQLSWWRNRASLAVDTTTASNNNLINKLQAEFRMLRKFGSPDHFFPCGSDFLTAVELELRSKGNYTQDGWAKQGKIDASVADLAFKGVELVYEPLLDDLSLSKYGYVLDMNAIKLRPMAEEDMVDHNPARPPEKYVLYKAKTWTGALMARQLNTSGVYSIL